ncbi:MAG: nucleolar RNA-binding Nop10p family protein, partial [Methanobacteriaceae archaeon]
EYTLKDSCPYCEGEITVVYPPKYSVGDKYGKYRRILKKEVEAKLAN